MTTPSARGHDADRSAASKLEGDGKKRWERERKTVEAHGTEHTPEQNSEPRFARTMATRICLACFPRLAEASEPPKDEVRWFRLREAASVFAACAPLGFLRALA